MRITLFIVAMAVLGQSSSELPAQRPDLSNPERTTGQNNDPPNDAVRKKKRQGGGVQSKKPAGDPNVIFVRLDRNGDGKLTADEVPEPMQRRLGQIDADNDGSITRKELAAAFIKRMRNSRNAGGGQRGPQKGQMRPDREPSSTTMIQRLDANADGRISLEEAPERMKDKFARMDANGDGFVDGQELDSVMQKMKQGKTKGRYDTDPKATKGQLPKRPSKDG